MKWLVFLSVVGLTACHIHPHGRASVRMEVGHDHHCGRRCHHYFWDGHWYDAHHRHGPGCGHELRGGIWVRLRP